MYVKDHMTANPITITPDTSVSKALDLGLHCVVFSNNVPLEDERMEMES